jgi:hypothetical protein
MLRAMMSSRLTAGSVTAISFLWDRCLAGACIISDPGAGALGRDA